MTGFTRIWTSDEIKHYQRWVANDPSDQLLGTRLDCADFAVFLLVRYAKERGLPVAFGGRWEASGRIKKGRILLPGKSPIIGNCYDRFALEAAGKIEARELHEARWGNTEPIDFSLLAPGDLLTSEGHVQIVLNPESKITVDGKAVQVLEILQGNLWWFGATLIQHRAWDTSEKPIGPGRRRYYVYNGRQWSFYKNETLALSPRRWRFWKFNSAYNLIDKGKPVPERRFRPGISAG